MSQEKEERIWLDETAIEGGIVKPASIRAKTNEKSDFVKYTIPESVHEIDEKINSVFPGRKLLRDDEFVKENESRGFEVRKIFRNKKGEVFLTLMCLELDRNNQVQRILKTFPASNCTKITVH